MYTLSKSRQNDWDAARVAHKATIESPSAKAIQLLFDGHSSFAQRQTVASFIAPRVTK
jgi:hypothetical protein